MRKKPLEVYREKGKHCAFTDLIHFRGYYYLCFRVGKEHMFSKGKIMVLWSKDGKDWNWFAESKEIEDIRDPRFYIDGNKLKILINVQQIEKLGILNRKKYIKKQYSALWDFVKNDWKFFDLGFITYISGKDYFVYDAVNSRYISDGDVFLPMYYDSTEGAFFTTSQGSRVYLIRRDRNTSYWLVKNKDKMTIYDTGRRLHCPYIFQTPDKRRFLLARETSKDYKKSTLDLYEIESTLELIHKKRFKGYGDCGYMSFAYPFVSFYSSYDKKDLNKTAIYVQDISDVLSHA